MFRIRNPVDMKISLIQLRIAGVPKGIFLHLLHPSAPFFLNFYSVFRRFFLYFKYIVPIVF